MQTLSVTTFRRRFEALVDIKTISGAAVEYDDDRVTVTRRVKTEDTETALDFLSSNLELHELASSTDKAGIDPVMEEGEEVEDEVLVWQQIDLRADPDMDDVDEIADDIMTGFDEDKGGQHPREWESDAADIAHDAFHVYSADTWYEGSLNREVKNAVIDEIQRRVTEMLEDGNDDEEDAA